MWAESIPPIRFKQRLYKCKKPVNLYADVSILKQT